ncbi:MAG: hypothetical protein Q4D50_12340 [Eubacteriales bacterium]|nr:hypothetical protein [Eubacteriales bacterium]
MSEMEEKLGAILNNPQMMQQIMSMAQAMSASQPPKEEPPKPSPPPQPSLPDIDPNMLRSLAGMVRQGGVDRNQQALLKALSPYLSQNRVNKLERAMRAAKMAGLASTFLNSGGLQLLSGR